VQVLHTGELAAGLRRALGLRAGAAPAERGRRDASGDQECECERDEDATQGRGTHPHHGIDGRSAKPRAGSDPDNLLESSWMSEDASAARAAWRAEEDRWSRAALEQWEHTRALADVVRDCMHRGDRATFVLPTVTWSGPLVAVGNDIARVAVGATLVDLRLAPAAPFVLRVRSTPNPGQRGDASVTTFLARLRELDGTSVSIGLISGSLEGGLRLGRDQIRLDERDGSGAYVPTGSVWWVRPLDDD
jgi:hypothetical protein